MRFSKSNLLIFCALVLWALFGQGCANIVPPSGGEKDITAPVLLSETPGDSALNKDVYKITLTFNKFMEVHDLAKNIVTSPLLPIQPTVTAFARKVIITLPDSSLQPNTTYRIALGNALTDNREQTPYKNFTYLFSTGSYFDSLQLKGYAWDAATGLPDTSATIFLYAADKSDSAVFRDKPLYIQKVGADGHFIFENLPDKPFRAFAVSDKDNNHVYTTAQEKIDFSDSLVRPAAQPEKTIQFSLFTEKSNDSTATATPTPSNSKDRFSTSRKEKEKTQNKLAFRVMADTVRKTTGTADLAQPLKIALFQPLSTIDSNRIYLSYDDKGIDVEAPHHLTIDSSQILINLQWQADKTYTLRLIKGWAKDTSGQELAPGKYIFHTKSLNEYATLNINVDSVYVGSQFLIMLYKEGKTVWQKAATTNKFSIPLLSPGDYTLRLVEDSNGNGQWDTGDLLKRRHAEKVIPYKGKILLKEGWVNDVDIKYNPEPSGPSTKENRFSEQK